MKAKLAKAKKQKKTKVIAFKDTPKILHKRYYYFLGLSVATFVVGTIFVIIGFGSVLAMLLMFWLTAIASALFAIKYRYDLEHKGYSTTEGIVTHKKDILTIPSNPIKDRRTKRPLYYHIKTKTGKIYRLDVSKGNEEIPLRATVRIYYPTTAYERDNNGIISLTTIWAHEIVEEALPEAVLESADDEI